MINCIVLVSDIGCGSEGLTIVWRINLTLPSLKASFPALFSLACSCKTRGVSQE